VVDTSITPTKDTIQVLGAENTLTVNGNLADYRHMSIAQSHREENPDITGQKTAYDFLVSSSGAAGPVVASVHHRAIGKVLNQAQGIVSFFTGVRIGVDDQFHVIRKGDIGQEESYDLFFTWSDVLGTLTNLNITVETVQVPDTANGVTGAGIPLPPVINATDPVHSVAVLRSVQGGVRTYDIFTVYQP
jgi:hypothetical protein